MLKRKTIIPMAAIMLMSTSISSYAEENKLENKDNFKEIKYKTATVEPKRGLNVRKTNEISDDNKIYAAIKGTEFEVVGQEDEWYKVELQNNEFGWINSNYAKLENKQLYVNVEHLNFREGGNLDSKVIEVLNKGTELEIIESNDEWIKVKYENKEGYVYSKYIIDEKIEEEKNTNINTNTNVNINNNNANTNTNTKPENIKNPVATQKPSVTTQKPSANNGNSQSKVVNLAYAQLGKPYVWGSEGPNSFDCSGLMTYIFKNGAGINLPRTSKQQSQFGATVSRNNLQPGDLIFSSTDGSGSVSHVGVYVGNGEMIHSPRTGDVVKKSNINSSYWNKAYLWAKRVL